MRSGNLLFLVIPASQLLMISGNISGGQPLDFWGYGGVVLSIAADILLLYVLLWGSRQKALKKELQELSYLQEAEHMRTEMLEEKQKELCAMRSDFEKNLDEIRKNLRQGEKEAADIKLKKFQERLESAGTPGYCQNTVVNAIISEKEKEFQRLGIKTSIRLLIPHSLNIDPLHLCSLFSNLLDNALEAVEELEEAERKIQIDASIRGSYLVVKVQNPSTKGHADRKRRKGRGYGAQILKSLARTYDGSYQAVFEKGWYKAFVSVKAV